LLRDPSLPSLVTLPLSVSHVRHRGLIEPWRTRACTARILVLHERANLDVSSNALGRKLRVSKYPNLRDPIFRPSLSLIEPCFPCCCQRISLQSHAMNFSSRFIRAQIIHENFQSSRLHFALHQRCSFHGLLHVSSLSLSLSLFLHAGGIHTYLHRTCTIHPDKMLVKVTLRKTNARVP